MLVVPGSGAVLTLRDGAINELTELNTDAIVVIESGQGYVNPQVQIVPDPAYPEPTFQAQATAYLSNPKAIFTLLMLQTLMGHH